MNSSSSSSSSNNKNAAGAGGGESRPVRNPYQTITGTSSGNTTSNHNNNNNNRGPPAAFNAYNASNNNNNNANNDNTTRMIGDANLLDSMAMMMDPPPRPPTAAATTAAAATAAAAVTFTVTDTASTENASPTASSPHPSQPQEHRQQDQHQDQQNQQHHQHHQQQRRQLEALQEANFDLEATLATLQAEQQYELQQLQTKMKEETAKLQHSLRLEQQTTRRLLQSQSQNQNQNQQNSSSASTNGGNSKRARVLHGGGGGGGGGGEQTADAFRKRLPTTTTTTNASTMGDVAMNDAAMTVDHHDWDHDASPASANINGKGQQQLAPPPEIDINLSVRRSSMGTATTAQTTPLPPSPWPPTSSETTPSNYDQVRTRNNASGAAWLARQLLHHCPSTTTTTTNSSFSSSLDIRNVLIPIATGDPADVTAKDPPSFVGWTETQLVEYLLLWQEPQETIEDEDKGHSQSALILVSYWTQAFTWSPSARRGFLQAMQFLEQREDEANDDEERGREEGDTAKMRTANSSSSKKRRKPSRIHRLNPQDGSRGDEPVVVETDDPTCTMDPESIQDWFDHRFQVHNPQHLQLLALILNDDNDANIAPHSTTIWWNSLMPRITEQLIGLHAKCTTTTMTTTATMGTVTKTTNTTQQRNSQDLWGGGNAARRLRFQSPMITTTTKTTSSSSSSSSSMFSQEDEALLLACLTLMERLVAVTSLDVLEDWCITRVEAAGAPRQPYLLVQEQDVTLTEACSEESALLWIGLVLDIVEGLLQYHQHQQSPITATATSSRPPSNSGSAASEKGDDPAKQKTASSSLALPKWYLALVSFFVTMGQTKGGMKILRTRLPDSTGGEAMPNVLDTATMQLFHLSFWMDKDHQNHGTNKENHNNDNDYDAEYLTFGREQRLFVMDYWIRLWHQALLFVQGQHQPMSTATATTTTTTISSNKPVAMVSFRSLLLELQDYYTSAYTRILTDPFVKPEIYAMIRLQLEELALDEEEHDDWKE